MARNERFEKFEASVHLTPYEVHDERWSLSTLDKQITRRRNDAKLAPDRAARLDWRFLARLNYSSADRREAADEVEHSTFVRGETVRQTKKRRAPLITDRNTAREMVEVLEDAYDREHRSRELDGRVMPEPRYEPYQVKSLEASAEALFDTKLLREVHDLEKSASRGEPEASWEGRAVAREIMSGMAVEETKNRLQHFLESQKVVSLNLGDHRTGTLREVEARTLTDYLARALASKGQREHRHSINLAAREHHGRLVSDFKKTRDYHQTASELASESRKKEARFTDKEKINLEIYAEHQNDEAERERYLELARNESHSQEHDVSASYGR